MAARFEFETGIYRPPSEGGSCSLLVRFTRNCPWNRCTFCGMYKTERFAVRPLAEIRADIDTMAALCSELDKRAAACAEGPRSEHAAAMSLLRDHPELNYHAGFGMLYEWWRSGGRTAFLQDANSLIMKTADMVAALQHLRAVFPSLRRVTSYARSRTLMQKPAEELQAIHAAGLDRLHVGLESGDDEVLKLIHKGVTAEGHIAGGRKALAAGFQLSEYWMPGLGGQSHWQNHARNTARVLSAINPHYIRSRPFHPLPGTPLTEAIRHRRFEMLSPEGQLHELKLTIEELSVTGRVCFDHAGNYWRRRDGRLLFTQGYEGYQFPDEKEHVLELIAEGLSAGNQLPVFKSL